MSLTQPTLNSTPFAKNSVKKNEIPLTTMQGGKASFDLGFPPETMDPYSSSGIPPDGKDFNGIFNQLSQHQVWTNAGGKYKFNGELANAIGGYAKGSVLLLDDGLSTVISTIDNNINNPNSVTTGWVAHGGDLKLDKTGGTITGDVTIDGELTLGTSSLVGKNGHTYLPNGYIYQFGYIAFSDMTVITQASPAERYAVIDLPIPFPTDILNITATLRSTGASNLVDVFTYAAEVSKTTIIVGTNNFGAQVTTSTDDVMGLWWSVIGC